MSVLQNADRDTERACTSALNRFRTERLLKGGRRPGSDMLQNSKSDNPVHGNAYGTWPEGGVIMK